MARVYVVPLRNDLAGMGLQITDLGSDPQNFYVRWFSKDAAVHTSPLAATVATDTDGAGGNDSHVTQADEYGLLAYLRDRVEANPGGTNDRLTPGQALNIANAIYALAATNAPLTLAAINAILVAEAGANTDLDGAGGASDSFGTVEEILRILAGEVYLVPDNTIVGDQNANFLTTAQRNVLVAAAAAAGNTFFAGGRFIARTEANFRDVPVLVRTGAFNLSSSLGKIQGFQQALAILNPSFAYSAAQVTQFRPRAVDITGANLPTTGSFLPIAVYTNTGAAL